MSPKTRTKKPRQSPMPAFVAGKRTKASGSNRKRDTKELERIFLEKWVAARRALPNEAMLPVTPQPVASGRPVDTTISDAHKKAISDAYLAELANAPKPEYKDDDEDY